ncbi:MAG: glycosyltransferase [Candidatus Omnitrophica bacterium]|nr:glycosyltransferase [Candidatus Omnitrophota bacterium]
MPIQNYKFSVIIATYNRSDYLKRSIASIFEQDYQEFEIIISDDASSDSTKDVPKSFNDPRIIYICNDRNSGLSATRNAGLKKSGGDFFVIIDDDTTLRKDFLRLLNKAISDTNMEAFCPKIIDPQDNLPFIEFALKKERQYLNYSDFNCFRGGSHIFSKDVLKELGLYDERFGIGSRYPAAEESDYFFRIKKSGRKILYCPELVAYHLKEINPSSAKVFNYSYGIAAMFTKNLFSDPGHFYFYFYILSYRLLISLFRTLQYRFFPKSIQLKNYKYKYSSFLKGTACGIIDYIRFK